MNAIGVDIGGTKIAAAVVTPEGKILNEVRYPTQAVPPDRLVGTIARAITEVKDRFEVGGACVAVPGFVLTAGNKAIDPTGPRCRCGNHGCLEAFASGTAIQRRAREVANERPASALGQLATDRQVLGEDVTRLAEEGDEASISVLEETGRWLGIGLAGFVNIFNPEVIAVGGASRAGELILESAREEVQLRARFPLTRPGQDRRGYAGPGIRRARRCCACTGQRRGVHPWSFQVFDVKRRTTWRRKHVLVLQKFSFIAQSPLS